MSNETKVYSNFNWSLNRTKIQINIQNVDQCVKGKFMIFNRVSPRNLSKLKPFHSWEKIFNDNAVSRHNRIPDEINLLQISTLNRRHNVFVTNVSFVGEGQLLWKQVVLETHGAKYSHVMHCTSHLRGHPHHPVCLSAKSDFIFHTVIMMFSTVVKSL